jgi:hypothetical protein
VRAFPQVIPDVQTKVRNTQMNTKETRTMPGVMMRMRSSASAGQRDECAQQQSRCVWRVHYRQGWCAEVRWFDAHPRWWRVQR